MKRTGILLILVSPDSMSATSQVISVCLAHTRLPAQGWRDSREQKVEDNSPGMCAEVSRGSKSAETATAEPWVGWCLAAVAFTFLSFTFHSLLR